MKSLLSTHEVQQDRSGGFTLRFHSYKMGLTIILFKLSIGLTVPGFAQEAVVSAGGNTTGSNGSISFSVGQVFFHTNEGTEGTVSEGVQQPYEIFVITSAEHLSDISLQMSAFPNPVSHQLNLRIDNAGDLSAGKLTYQLFDFQGRVLLIERVVDYQTPIDMSFFEPAVYFLNVLDGNQKIKTFKVVKR
jgi:hypothetical protein